MDNNYRVFHKNLSCVFWAVFQWTFDFKSCNTYSIMSIEILKTVSRQIVFDWAIAYILSIGLGPNFYLWYVYWKVLTYKIQIFQQYQKNGKLEARKMWQKRNSVHKGIFTILINRNKLISYQNIWIDLNIIFWKNQADFIKAFSLIYAPFFMRTKLAKNYLKLMKCWIYIN